MLAAKQKMPALLAVALVAFTFCCSIPVAALNIRAVHLLAAKQYTPEDILAFRAFLPHMEHLGWWLVDQLDNAENDAVQMENTNYEAADFSKAVEKARESYARVPRVYWRSQGNPESAQMVGAKIGPMLSVLLANGFQFRKVSIVPQIAPTPRKGESFIDKRRATTTKSADTNPDGEAVANRAFAHLDGYLKRVLSQYK